MNNAEVKATVKKWTAWSDWKAMCLSSNTGVDITSIKLAYLATK